MGNETENSGLPDWASEQLKRWNSLAFRTLPPTKCDRDNVAAVEKRIADLEKQLANYKKAHTVHQLTENQDQSAFVFTSRLQYVIKEFEGTISTAAAIGALEVVKHELIADALLEQSNGI